MNANTQHLLAELQERDGLAAYIPGLDDLPSSSAIRKPKKFPAPKSKSRPHHTRVSLHHFTYKADSMEVKYWGYPSSYTVAIFDVDGKFMIPTREIDNHQESGDLSDRRSWISWDHLDWQYRHGEGVAYIYTGKRPEFIERFTVTTKKEPVSIAKEKLKLW